MHHFKKFVFICLALSCFADSALKANLFFNEKLVTAISDKTSLSPQLVDVILASAAATALVGVLALCAKLEINSHREKIIEEQEREQKLSDDDVIQEGQKNLEWYKSRFEDDCTNAAEHTIEDFILYIKQKNYFPYFIPYRSKVAQAAIECTKSLDHITQRFCPHFTPYNAERNLDGLNQLKQEYVEFIEKLKSLQEVAYQCIKSSTIEYIIFNWILSVARTRKGETPIFHFSYLVNDLI